MEKNDFYLEELLCDDAAKIVIDEEFKKQLKNKLMLGDDYKDITKPTKNKFKQNRYFKIASGFVICVFVSGAILKAIDVQSKGVIVKGERNPSVNMSIVAQKDSNKIISNEQGLLQPKAKVPYEDGKTNELIAQKTKKSSDTNEFDIKENVDIKRNTKDAKTGNENTNNKNTNNENTNNENTSNVTAEESDEQINNNFLKTDKRASVSIDVKGPIEVPNMNDLKENTGEILKFYDSRYSVDEMRLVSVKDGGIYVQDIATSKENKVIAYNDKINIINKPNFTPNDGIVYYKAENVTLKNGNSEERNGAIYLSDKNGQGTTKIVDGKSPMISKDGKRLVYEAEGKIYIMILANKGKKLIDNGNYPAFADNGNLISYVKEEKGISNLWVFDLLTGHTHSLTNNGTNINHKNIQSWALAVTNSHTDSNIDVKYSYFESIWCTNNKEIYAIRKNNEAKVFELIKFNLTD